MSLTAIQLQELRRLLAERRSALLDETREDVERSRGETYPELASGVHDAGDEAQAALLADLGQAEISRDLRRLRELEAAEARIAAGTYGECTDCGREIDFERLRAYPAALRCLACQSVHEKTFAHPGEPRL
jgi:RNA polymerase-binding transcription factor DksA